MPIYLITAGIYEDYRIFNCTTDVEVANKVLEEVKKDPWYRDTAAIEIYEDCKGESTHTRMSEPDYHQILNRVMSFVREGAGTYDIECALCNAIEEAYELGFEDGKELQKNGL